MTRVEFPKQRRRGDDRPRVTYSLPLDALERVSEPGEGSA
jgi:hypothetical protein